MPGAVNQEQQVYRQYMKEQLTAIFDIGKTNKKFFLFNSALKEIYREYTQIPETTDEDGHPTENLDALQDWLRKTFDRILNSRKYDIEAINFSTYGASLVHLDQQGRPLAPLYNYTKPLEPELQQKFYSLYGPEDQFCSTTGTSNAGMLNSGMQLFWLKHRKPELFGKIRSSLHLPQYLSYLFTGVPLSEYTSIGCHTTLWDYSRKDYHHWVTSEGIDALLPPVISAETSINMTYPGKKRIRVGVGIHDSSAALIPYIRSLKKHFILLSTGTWSIALNPFADSPLSVEDVRENCINYMRINGQPVRAARLFLGNEYTLQVKELTEKYKVAPDHHKSVVYQAEIHKKIKSDFRPMFAWKSLEAKGAPAKSLLSHPDFETAYHQLMYELVALQAAGIRRSIGQSHIKRLYIDGGFTDNPIFLEFLAQALPSMKLRTTKASLGSALGAAIAISGKQLSSEFLKENYAMRKHVPKILN